ncbi:hypothetical protein [Cupriavidus sp. BIS7]|uniref:hypothetical protein n=1 Tax=Cupriavidus sp. BIS7 TaxID=1217718 RepID=UPI0002FAA0C4|nr:hypothetical protein [Cupriavidus sp. BIS7]
MANSTPNKAPDTRVRQLPFAFPFRRKGEGNAAGKDISDEHEFHALLKKEASGNYSVSAKGLWHGGIHISEGGAGTVLDLKHGVRCIADGEVVAFRVNRTYLASQMPAQDDQPAREARYSTGFALVRHTMEFPTDNKLTFFSLYMHLQDLADYDSDKTLPRPAYWTPDFKVTQFARDKPTGGRTGATPSSQVGLRVRATHPRGTPLCILPHGAQVSISKRKGNWGQITDTHGAQLIPPAVGGYAPTAAIGGWMFLGKEDGHPVAEAVVPDAMLDRVVTLAKPVPIKAGDLIGHLGRYDSLNQRAETRMVHIEAFCGDGIKTFIEQGRDWVENRGFRPEAWKPLGLPSEPTILRVARNTRLYRVPFNEGEDLPLTDVIQIAALATLGKNPENKRDETVAGSDGKKRTWWHVQSADVHGHDIEGWVRQENFAGGRVTLEHPQSWIDFECLDDSHDPTHTMFGTTKAYVDYSLGEDVPAPADMKKLNPLMAKIYRAIYQRGDGSQAADELRMITDDPWRAMRVSRLIIKHESEWANPGKWRQLIQLIQEGEKRTEPQPQYVEEQKRIEELVWWDDVKSGVSDLPGSDVFHMHPVALVGNFLMSRDECACGCCFVSKFSVTRAGSQYGPVYWGDRPLERSKLLEELTLRKEISDSERRILVAMSPNEGNLDSVQSYDSEIVTAGAMQKTINPTGGGELPTQVAAFRSNDEEAYIQLFEKCGWSVEGRGSQAKMFYTHPVITNGNKITGSELKSIIRQGCSPETYRQKIGSVPLAVIVSAITDKRYERLQLMDFLTRLRNDILPQTPRGYDYTIGSYFQSDLGRATALDHHINRPGYVRNDIGAALKRFFNSYPTAPANPAEWGERRQSYEATIIEDYGNNRRMAVVNGQPVAPGRYRAMKSRLN